MHGGASHTAPSRPIARPTSPQLGPTQGRCGPVPSPRRIGHGCIRMAACCKRAPRVHISLPAGPTSVGLPTHPGPRCAARRLEHGPPNLDLSDQRTFVTKPDHRTETATTNIPKLDHSVVDETTIPGQTTVRSPVLPNRRSCFQTPWVDRNRAACIDRRPRPGRPGHRRPSASLKNARPQPTATDAARGWIRRRGDRTNDANSPDPVADALRSTGPQGTRHLVPVVPTRRMFHRLLFDERHLQISGQGPSNRRTLRSHHDGPSHMARPVPPEGNRPKRMPHGLERRSASLDLEHPPVPALWLRSQTFSHRISSGRSGPGFDTGFSLDRCDLVRTANRGKGTRLASRTPPNPCAAQPSAPPPSVSRGQRHASVCLIHPRTSQVAIRTENGIMGHVDDPGTRASSPPSIEATTLQGRTKFRKDAI